jgi:predicted DCC family thiol-disulfide oxidoreductase YuxK
MAQAKILNVIYDGHCNFCVNSLRIVAAVDLRNSLRFYDFHQEETFAKFPVLSAANAAEAMYTVVVDEPLYSGFFAFRRLIWNSPLTLALVPIFYFPGATLIGPRIYAWVARNRSRLGCRSDICDLPFPPGPEART